MKDLLIKPTLRSLQLIAQMERLFGVWTAPNKKLSLQVAINAEAIWELSNFKVEKEDIELALNSNLNLSKQSISLLSQNLGAKPGLRSDKLTFVDISNRPIFTAVSPFVIEARLNELLEWTETELERGEVHAAITCAIFHLVILHLHPFSNANHALSLVVSSQLIKNFVFNSYAQSPIASYFLARNTQYFSTLRQGEKSCFGDWLTVNAWIEFFLETLLLAQQDLEAERERINSSIKLNDTQSKILSCVQNLGLGKREEIAKLTGINLATIKYNLAILTERGCLKRQGEGRASTYAFLRKLG